MTDRQKHNENKGGLTENQGSRLQAENCALLQDISSDSRTKSKVHSGY